jgi:S-adenosylmethionine-diacylgycerolhomoserine-N-methlytransferase
MTSLLSDLRVLYHLVAKPVRGADHAARMESFYAGQAAGYDSFRDRLLQGRRELYASIPIPDGGVWLDLGGGTAANLEFIGDRLSRLRKVYVVDLSPSLLEVAQARIRRNGWTNVEAVHGDATTFRSAEGAADVVTFSYALTMIPDWFAAVENARRALAPGGVIGVVDFFVARKHPAAEMPRHSWCTRTFWPAWFAADNVFPSADHLPFLQSHFEPLRLTAGRAKVPYLPLLRVPYYQFVGRNSRAEQSVGGTP